MGSTSAFTGARATLDTSYSKLIAEVTKSGDVAKAKALQAEEGNLASVPQAEKKPSTPPNPAKEGAVAWNGHKYKVFNEKCSWHDAVKRCQAMGGYLVIVNDEKEQTFIAQLLGVDDSGKSSAGVWIGATDEAKEGVWVWVDGSRVDYTNWGKNDPNNHGGKSHWAVLSLHHRGTWDDRGPTSPSVGAFICEWND